jgi:serpin B
MNQSKGGKMKNRLLFVLSGFLAAVQPAMAQDPSNRFGLELLQAFSKPGENVMISPYSIHGAVGMALLGAAGETESELMRITGRKGWTPDSVYAYHGRVEKLLKTRSKTMTFTSANAVFLNSRYSLKNEFETDVKRHYQAEVKRISYSSDDAAAAINNWVKDKTRGLIPSIVDKIQPEQTAHIINALHFKGAWSDPFEKSATHADEFFSGAGTTAVADFMRKRDGFQAARVNGAEVVTIPFDDRNWQMTVIMPAGKKGLDWLKKRTASELDAMIKEVRWEDLDLFIPRIKLESSFAMSSELKKLNYATMFSPKADFPDIVEGQGFVVSEILHKTILKMEETGAEAAAVTAISMETTAVAREPDYRIVRVNKPYLLLLRESQSGVWLFAAWIENAGTIRF